MPPADLAQVYSPVQEAQQILDQHNALASVDASQQAPEQADQQIGFNPMLMRLFLQARGNEQLSKMYSSLLVADVATKHIISYADSIHAHQDMVQQQAMDVMDPFGTKKSKKDDDEKSSERRYAAVAA